MIRLPVVEAFLKTLPALNRLQPRMMFYPLMPLIVRLPQQEVAERM